MRRNGRTERQRRGAIARRFDPESSRFRESLPDDTSTQEPRSGFFTSTTLPTYDNWQKTQDTWNGVEDRRDRDLHRFYANTTPLHIQKIQLYKQRDGMIGLVVTTLRAPFDERDFTEEEEVHFTLFGEALRRQNIEEGTEYVEHFPGHRNFKHELFLSSVPFDEIGPLLSKVFLAIEELEEIPLPETLKEEIRQSFDLPH
jgi:hypothetical protein